MKYFKQELLTKCRSRDDQVADAAAKEWDKAAGAYRRRLKAIEAHLPPSVRRFLAQVSLHDAKIIDSIANAAFSMISVVVQLEGTRSLPGDLLQLFYLTDAQPRITKLKKKWILYNELDWDQQGKVCTHSLLLSDGTEVKIPFREFDFRTIEISQVTIETCPRIPAATAFAGTNVLPTS